MLIAGAPKSSEGYVYVYNVEELDTLYVVLISVSTGIVTLGLIIFVFCYFKKKKTTGYIPIPPQI